MWNRRHEVTRVKTIHKSKCLFNEPHKFLTFEGDWPFWAVLRWSQAESLSEFFLEAHRGCFNMQHWQTSRTILKIRFGSQSRRHKCMEALSWNESISNVELKWEQTFFLIPGGSNDSRTRRAICCVFSFAIPSIFPKTIPIHVLTSDSRLYLYRFKLWKPSSFGIFFQSPNRAVTTWLPKVKAMVQGVLARGFLLDSRSIHFPLALELNWETRIGRDDSICPLDFFYLYWRIF